MWEDGTPLDLENSYFPNNKLPDDASKPDDEQTDCTVFGRQSVKCDSKNAYVCERIKHGRPAIVLYYSDIDCSLNNKHNAELRQADLVTKVTG